MNYIEFSRYMKCTLYKIIIRFGSLMLFACGTVANSVSKVHQLDRTLSMLSFPFSSSSMQQQTTCLRIPLVCKNLRCKWRGISCMFPGWPPKFRWAHLSILLNCGHHIQRFSPPYVSISFSSQLIALSTWPILSGVSLV